ncbi:MAG: RecB family exonuclease [Marmoricola sp.]
MVDGVAVLGALSPSRAGDFKTCPLLFRYRTIDKLPERPSPAALRGTVIHKVLEDLFDLPAAQRTPEQADAMIRSAWEVVHASEPAVEALFEGDSDALEAWLEGARPVLQRYFDLEDPSRIEPAEREAYVEALLDSKLLLRGVIDRIDVAPDGAIRVNDYKSGPAPGESFEARALFQLRFYALVIWRSRGVIPEVLRLIYLGSTEMLSYSPDEKDLLATERLVQALWEAIRTAQVTGEWLPQKGFGCQWCSFQAHCPEYGGAILPLPDPKVREVAGAQAEEGVGEHPALAVQHGDVVGHDQHGAASGLG